MNNNTKKIKKIKNGRKYEYKQYKYILRIIRK